MILSCYYFLPPSTTIPNDLENRSVAQDHQHQQLTFNIYI